MQIQKHLLILLLCVSPCAWCDSGGIDSILQKVQNNKKDSGLAEEAIQLPYDKIVNNLNKSLLIYRTLYDNGVFLSAPAKRAALIEKLALVVYLKGNNEESFNLHRESIQLFDQVKDYRQKANAMAAMGYESKRRNLSQAMDIMKEAIGILTQNKYETELTSALDNYGVLFEMKEEPDSAEFYYKKALDLKIKIKDSVGIPYSLNNLAGICFLKREFGKGLSYISRSSEIRKRKNDYLGICWNEYSVGEMYISLHDPKTAEQYLRNSLRLATEKGYPELISRNLKLMAEVFSYKKQHDSAYIFLNRFYELHDSLYNIEKQNQILEMETVYETEKKSFRIKVLNNENSLKEAEIEKKRNTVYLLGVIVILLGAGGIMITRAYQQKNRANKIIYQQKLETERQKAIIQDKQKEILDSIHYAKRIQQSLMPVEKYIDKTLVKLKKEKV